MNDSASQAARQTFGLSIGESSTVWSGGGVYDWRITNATGIAGTAWDTQVVPRKLDLRATPDSPFTIQLHTLTAAGNSGWLAGFNAAGNQNWLIAQAGSITNFDPDAFQVLDAGFLNDLHGGTWFVTTNSSNGVLLNFLANPPPVANALTMYRGSNMPCRLLISELLTNVSDANGIPAFAGVSTNVMTAGQLTTNLYPHFLAFVPAAPDTDVNVTAGYGVRDTAVLRAGDTPWLASNTVAIIMVPSGGISLGTISSRDDGSLLVQFAGIPEFPYQVQRCTNLTAATWETIHTTNAPAKGIFNFIDSTPPMPRAFYRLLSP